MFDVSGSWFNEFFRDLLFPPATHVPATTRFRKTLWKKFWSIFDLRGEENKIRPLLWNARNQQRWSILVQRGPGSHQLLNPVSSQICSLARLHGASWKKTLKFFDSADGWKKNNIARCFCRPKCNGGSVYWFQPASGQTHALSWIVCWLVPNVRSSGTPSATAVCVEQDGGTSKTTTDLERCLPSWLRCAWRSRIEQAVRQTVVGWAATRVQWVLCCFLLAPLFGKKWPAEIVDNDPDRCRCRY